MSKEIKFHEVCDIFPRTKKSVRSIADSIKAGGQLDPILYIVDPKTKEELVIDGKTRYLACELLDIAAEYSEVKIPASDLVDYVWRKNVDRRHLTDPQIMVCAAKAKNIRNKATEAAKRRMEQGASRGGSRGGSRGDKAGAATALPLKQQRKSREDVAESVGLDKKKGRTLQKVFRAVDKGIPEVADAIYDGEITPNAADRVVKVPKEEQAEKLKQAKQGKVMSKPQKEKKTGDGELPSRGIVLANEAINVLKQIPKNDKHRERAGQIVKSWINSNLK